MLRNQEVRVELDAQLWGHGGSSSSVCMDINLHPLPREDHYDPSLCLGHSTSSLRLSSPWPFNNSVMRLFQLSFLWSLTIIFAAAVPPEGRFEGIEYLRLWLRKGREGGFGPTSQSIVETLPFPSLKKLLRGERTEQTRKEVCAQCMAILLQVVGNNHQMQAIGRLTVHTGI